MYKFTNGYIVYDKITADKFINAGYKLVVENNYNKEKQNSEDNIICEAIIEDDEASNKFINKTSKKNKKSARTN